MNLVFLCFLPFRSRIVQLGKKKVVLISQNGRPNLIPSRRKYYDSERGHVLFSWRDAQKKKDIFHTYICVYVQICML